MELPIGQRAKTPLHQVAGLHPFRAHGVEEGRGGDLAVANLSDNRS